MTFFYQKRILILSAEAWSHIPISKHHYAIALARAGAIVYFLNPPSKRNFVTNVGEGLKVIDYVSFRGINRLPFFVRNLLNKILINRLLKMVARIDVVWSFDPSRFQNLNLFEASIKIYHPVDVHQNAHETEVANSADLLLSVSDLILRRFESAKARKAKVNHGLQAHFAQHEYRSPSIPPKIVGYMGNLDIATIDSVTLVEIVRQNPTLQFHFIGPFQNGSATKNALSRYSNCSFLGRVPSDQLPGYFARIDIFLICYDGSKRDVNSNSHKIIEFLSTGKPIVMNYTDEYRDRRDLVIMANDNNQLPHLFKQVVTNLQDYCSEHVVAKRMQFAKSNTYDAHVAGLALLAEEVRKEGMMRNGN